MPSFFLVRSPFLAQDTPCLHGDHLGRHCHREAAMPVSEVQATKRAFVSIIKSLAVRHKVAVDISRESRLLPSAAGVRHT